jgi:hypothetical protein
MGTIHWCLCCGALKKDDGPQALPRNATPRDTGVGRIYTERMRQIHVENYTEEEDDWHDRGELVRAAASYLLYHLYWFEEATAIYPSDWDDDSFEPGIGIRTLEKAGALIAAEIDRLIRKRENND